MIIEKIRKKMSSGKVDGFLVTDRKNITYLSGFTGSAGSVFLTSSLCYLMTDFRYIEQAERETSGFIVVDAGRGKADGLKKLIKKGNIKTVAFEPEFVSYELFFKMQKSLSPAELSPVKGWVHSLRAVKTEDEIRSIRTACEITDRAMSRLTALIKPGIKEMDLEAELEYFVKKRENTKLSFPPVIISGRRTSLPHGRPSLKKLEKGEMLLVDFGVKWDGYCSDLTRTFCIGRMSEEKRSLYRTVLKNQASCIKVLKPGERSGCLFQHSDLLFRKNGYALRHGLGHGVGMEIHELPFLSGSAGMKLKKNMVLTIEPGVYIPGKFGVRIEDVVLLNEDGAEVLSKTPKGRNEI